MAITITSKITVLGAGMNGLTTAMLLARDGHDVTVLERDPEGPPPLGQAWERWDRQGVGQFRRAHYMLPRWRTEIEESLPDLLDDLVAAGGRRFNLITGIPEERRGPLRPGDERFETITARRPVLEAVVASAAERTAGLVVRRGVAVTGFVPGTPTAPEVPHVAGVRTADGERITGDLVVDCRGRRARLTDWLCAIGARPAVEEREDSGFVYYARHFRSADGAMPPVFGPLLQHHGPFSTITLPGDNGTWSVVLTTHSADRPLRALRDAAAWQAAVASCPLVAHWAAGPGIQPITDVDVMAGLDDRHRSLFVDGEPIVTGLALLGDAWACTNPSLGRGCSIGAIHARVLQHVLRDVDLDDPEKVVRRFDDATSAVVEPLYRATVGFDRHRLAELTGEIQGVPYLTDDPGWMLAKAMSAAALADPDVLRLFLRVSLQLELPQQVFADRVTAQRVLSLGAGAPRYPLPGPTRAEVLAAIGS